MAMANVWAGPGAEVITSNQASTASSAAVTAAASRNLSSRLISSSPVAPRLTASRLSRPVHAVAQCAARALPGSCVARANSHGIMPTPAATSARPSQGLAAVRARLAALVLVSMGASRRS
jgi:hypothetical protein